MSCARVHELVLQRRGGVDRVIGEVPRPAALVGAQPVVVAAQPFPVLADDAEAVDVAVALLPPVDELDAQLEGRLGPLHELGFVEREQLVELLDRRDRRLADADGADRFAFDQLDFVEALEQLAEQRGGHPTRRAAADDENLAHGLGRLPAFGGAGHCHGRFWQAPEPRRRSMRTGRSRGGTGYPPCCGRQSPAGQSNESLPVKSISRAAVRSGEEQIGNALPFGSGKPGRDERIGAVDEVVRRNRPARIEHGHDRHALAAHPLECLQVLGIAGGVAERRREK